MRADDCYRRSACIKPTSPSQTPGLLYRRQSNANKFRMSRKAGFNGKSFHLADVGYDNKCLQLA